MNIFTAVKYVYILHGLVCVLMGLSFHNMEAFYSEWSPMVSVCASDMYFLNKKNGSTFHLR